MSIEYISLRLVFNGILLICCFCSSSVANAGISSNNNKRVHHQQLARAPSRARRQSALQYPTVYYICGEFPNLAYQLTPCQRCRNGGRALYAQCTTAVQCTPYYRGPTECIDGQCCTGNELDINYPDGNAGFFDPYQNGAQGGYVGEQSEGFCPQGFRSMIRCSARGQCPPDQSCLNGVCCRRGKDDYVEACGGQMSIAQCVAGYCQDNFVCNTANFCCQCPVGRSMGRCNQGACPPGFRCQNGFCCASCPDNAMPFGVCTATASRDIPMYRNGQRQLSCPIGYSCLQGDICCKNTII
uniref:EB domain-containing protein n=1 Tax=Globodera pallida TaxID=36090 RepID=A0A183CNX5_GLOPA